MRFQKYFDKYISWGSKKVGLDLDYFIKGSFWTGIPIFLEAAINIIVSIIFARAVPIEVFGEYRFFQSVFTIFVILSAPGIGTALVQSVAKKYYGSLLDASRMMLKCSLLGSVAFVLSGLYLYFTGSQGMIGYFFIAAALFPFYNPFRTYISYLTGKENFKLLSKYSIIHTLFHNILFITAIVLAKNITIIVTTFFVAGNIISYILYRKVKKQYASEIQKSKTDKDLRRYGFHLTAMDILPTLSSNIDKILVTYFLGFKAIAIYGIALAISGQNNLFFKPLLKILLPRLSRQKNARKTYLAIRSKLPLAFLFSTGICLVGILIAPIFIKIFYPANYEASIIYAQVLLAAQIFALANIIFKNYLTSQKFTRGLYKVTIYPDVVRIVLLAILLPIYGIWGAVATDFLGRAYLFGLSWYVSGRESA